MKRLLILSILLVSLGSPVFAETLKVDQSTKEFIYQGKKYEITYVKYSNGYMDFNLPTSLDTSSPEGALFFLLKAIIDSDYDKWSSNWTPEALSYLKKTYNDIGLTKEKLISQWTEYSKINKNNYIIDKIEFVDNNKYAIIRYTSDERISQYGSSAIKPAIFIKINDKWFATHELKDHPIMNYMNEIFSSSKGTMTIE